MVSGGPGTSSGLAAGGSVAWGAWDSGLGSSKSANAKLHTWMRANGKLGGAGGETNNQKNHAKKTNQTKA